MAGAVLIAPGLASTDENGDPDVMRGEEVEILGIAEAGARLVVLPGSHCKWAVVEAGRVLRFKTFVTGELYAAIRDHTLIGAFARAAPPQSPGEAFACGARRGAEAARGESGGLLGALFGARTLPLMGKLPEADAGDYLSGLIIGAEIAEARRLFPDEIAACRGSKSARRALFDRVRRARRGGRACAGSSCGARTFRRRAPSRTLS